MQRFDVAGAAGDGQGPAPPQEIGQGRERQKSYQESCRRHGVTFRVPGSTCKVDGLKQIEVSGVSDASGRPV
jgi:hypothetical protein